MAELVDAPGLGPGGNSVQVRVLSPIPCILEKIYFNTFKLFSERKFYLMKCKNSFLLMLGICVVLGNFGVAGAKNVGSESRTVYLTGKGIANRLHKPVLEEFFDVKIKSIIIPEESLKANDEVVTFDDWLFLGTPVYKHKQNILCCAEKYKKILCEKPIGLSVSEINQIKDIINKNHILFRVNYALRFLPSVEKIEKFIKCNDIKGITVICNSNFNQNSPNKSWKSDYKLGGGIIYSILPHMVDLLNYLNFFADLNNITFQSTTKVPMNDIKLCSRTLSGIDMIININLCEKFDELTLKIDTSDGSETFDLIDSVENKISDNRYFNGTLSATSKISPWRISFKYLLETLFTNPSDSRLAKIEDAEKVHEVLDLILRQ